VNRTTIIILSLLGTLGVKSLFAQKLSVETRIDTNIIKLGDQIGLNYVIQKEENLKTKLPVFSDTLTAGIEIIGDVLIDSSVARDNLKQIDINLTITSFDTGIYYIPPQPIFYEDKGLTDTLFSRATYLMVVGVPIDSTYTIRDIKGAESMPITLGEILLYAGILLLVAALITFLIIYLRRKKQEKPLFKPLKPEEPAHITALRELDRLKAQKLWQQKQLKEYYTRITYIIRWYIEKRFSIPALELTSDEILEHIQHVGIENIDYSNLENLLNLADLVKFAKGDADPEVNILHLDNAYDFIKKTKEKSPVNLTNSNNSN
jgi:hypothetical protein